jgi:MFS family permease
VRGAHRLILLFATLTAWSAAGYGVMFTVLDDFRDAYGIGGGALGFIVGVGFFSSFFAQVLLAPLADRGHARMLVVAGLVLQIVGLIGMAVGRDVVSLSLARVVMGLGAGALTPAARRIVILAEPDRLGTNVGRLLAADVVGFSIGPAISVLLVDPIGIAAPFLLIASFIAVSIPFVLRVHVDETAESEVPTSRFAFDLLRHRPFAGAVCFGSALFLMLGTFDALWVLVHDDLDTAEWVANLGIIVFAVPLAVLGPYGGRLAQRLGPYPMATVGLSVGAVFMFAYGQIPTGMGIFLASLVHACSDGLTVSSSSVAVGMVAPAERQAGAQGMLGGIQTLVGGISAIVAGALYETSGRGLAYGACAAAMLVLIASGAWLGRSTWRLRGTPEPERVAAQV